MHRMNRRRTASVSVLAVLATLALILYVAPHVGRFLDLLWLKLQILLGLE